MISGLFGRTGMHEKKVLALEDEVKRLNDELQKSQLVVAGLYGELGNKSITKAHESIEGASHLGPNVSHQEELKSNVVNTTRSRHHHSKHKVVNESMLLSPLVAAVDISSCSQGCTDE